MTNVKFNFSKTVSADLIRLDGRCSLGCFIRSICLVRTFRPVFTMRLCRALNQGSWVRRKALGTVARIFHRIATNAAAMDLPWETNVGPGFCITHGWGVVISPRATIGANCTVMHGVTIGAKDNIGQNGERTTEYPVIEDEVFIGPHAVIVGGIRVGRGARIAAGTIVTNDVPSHAIVVGNPMRVIREHAEPDVMHPARIEL